MAGAVIGALRVNLGLNSAQFQNGLKQSQTGMQKFAKAAAIGFAAVAAAGAAAFASVASAAQRADNAWKQSQAMGIPIQELGRLQHAAEMSGASFSDLERTIRRTSQAINNSVQGISNTGTKSFDRLGVALTDAQGNARSTEEVLGDVAEVFSNMPDGAEKTAMAVDMFGRSGAQIIPLLNAGRDGLKEMGDEAERLGLVFDEATGRLGERFNDNLARMAKATTGLANAFGSMLLPAAVAVTDAIVAMMIPAGEMIGTLGEVARYAGVAVAGLAGFYAPTILAGIGTLSAAIGTGLVGAIRAVTVALMANPLGFLIAGISAAVAAVFIFRDEIKQIIGVDVVAVVKEIGNRIIAIFEGAYNAVVNLWQNMPHFFSGIGKMAWNSFISEFEKPAFTINGQTIIPGFDLSGLKADVSDEQMGAMAQSVAIFNDTLSSGRDYIGEWTSSLGQAWSQAGETTAAIDALGNSLDGGAGGGGGSGGGGLAGATKTASDALEEMGDIGQRVTSRIADGLTDAFMAAIEGGKSLGEIVTSLLKDLGRMFLNQGFQALLGIMSGGLGGGGGLFAGIGKLFGFARGGTILPGGSGGIDSQLVAFRKSPNERVDITKPGQTLTSGDGPRKVEINVTVDGARGNMEIQQMVSQGVAQGIKTVEKNIGPMLVESQMRQG